MPGSVHISDKQNYRKVINKTFSVLIRTFLISLTVIFCLINQNVKAANETFSSGAFIINMGVTPQTIGNGIKPYGLIYDLIRNNDVPVKWVISQTKVKDGVDFTHNGVSYRGGTFIICAEYRSAAVNAKIASWQAKGVVGATSVSSMTLDVTRTLRAVPNWAMDADNGDIAIVFLEDAEIPASAYYFRTPATLNSCDNLYVMPHADPEWDTHSNLYFWNKNSRGAIWAGCHAVSAMEGPDCVNPLDATQNLKFLSTNGLVRWTNHNNPTVPYSYSNVTDPVFQMMGTEDAAHGNGSERVYMPLKTTSTWNPSVKIGCYDPTQSDIPLKSDGPAALTLYGYAFNDTTRGLIMYQGGHDIEGSGPANVSAMRQFFNWSFLGASQKEPRVTYLNIPTFMIGGNTYNNLTANATSPVGFTTFTYQWSSTAGGVFTAPNASVTNYTPPATGIPVSAKIMCKVTDPCGRYTLTEFNFTNMPPPGAPIAYNDTISYSNLCNVTTQSINVLSNDYDEDGDMVNTINFIGGGNYGTFVNNGNGNVTYTPGWNFQGSDTMRYEVCDAVPLCTQATLVITTSYSGVCAINQYQRVDTSRADSVIHDNSITDPEDALGYPDEVNGGNALVAQHSSDNDSLTLRLFSQLEMGDTVWVRAGTDNNSCIDWTIMGAATSGGFVNGVNSTDKNSPGGAQKIYTWYTHIVTGPTRYIRIKIRSTACDNKLNVDAVYGIHRPCVSNVPVANVDNISTAANTPITTNVRSNDTDPQNGALSVTILSGPSNGTAGVNGSGNIVYTPDSAYSGSDQIIYKACNAACLCDTAIVNISVILYSPCSAGSSAYYRSGYGVNVTSSSNTTNPTDALNAPDAVDGSNALTARINNTIGANIVLDINDTIYAADTIVVRIAPDNNSANTIRVQANLTNAWGAPTTSTDFNLPVNTSKTYVNYNLILSADARYVRVIQTTTTADVDVDAITWNYWHCTSITNRPPAAANDSVTTLSNYPVFLNVSANDVDPDNNPTTISIIAPAASDGTPVVSGSGIIYTPDFGFIGNDTVTYQICDNQVPSLCDTAIMVVTVLPGPPVAMMDNATVNSNSFININVQANDTLSVTAYTYTTSLMPSILPPTNGTAILVGNNIQYTPNANFTGTDSLVYQLCDNGDPVQCDTAMVYITVTNQYPVANNDVDTTSACNSVIINAAANDTDPESGILTITSVSSPSNGTAVISNNQIVYTPNSSPVFTGTDSFYYFVCDDGSPSRCDSATVNVVVNSNNPPSNPPDAVDDSDLTRINQPAYITVLDNDSDPDLDSIRVDSTATGLLAPANGTIQYLPNNMIAYFPNYNFVGVDSFEYQVCDIHFNGTGCVNVVSSCSIAKVVVTVYNSPPAANDNYAYTINTVPISNSVGLNDYEPDGQNMTYTVITPPVTGSIVMNSDGTYTFTPDGVFVGVEAIEYIVCDDAIVSLCDTATLYITIDITNVPPNPQADTAYTVGITTYVGSVATNDTDPNGNINPSGFAAISGGNYGTIWFNMFGDFNYTADTGFIGTDYLYYEVCDLGMPVYCSQSFLTIIVGNLPPVTVNGNDTTAEDGVLNVTASNGILSNGDYDPNGLAVHVNTVPVVSPSNGVVVVSSDGSYIYTPDPDFNGTDFFVVDVCDDSLSEPSICSPDTTFMLVTPSNDSPVTVNDTASTNEDIPVSSTILTAGDVDPDSTVLTVNTTPVVDATNGSIVVNVNGTYTYTPDPDFNGTDTIVLSVCDSGNPMPSACTNDTLVITVNAVNDAPVTSNESNTTNEEVPVGGTVITGADTDLEGTVLSADTVAVSGPSNGTIDINTDGTYTYTPDPDFNGTDVIIISICDSGSPMPSACTNDTLTITVNPVNDPPLTVNDTASGNEDNPISSTILTAGDVDPDTTVLSVNTTPVVDASNGNIVVNVNGTYTYTPDPDFNGTDTIVLSVCDSGTPMPSACTNDTLVITVNPVNDAPVLMNDTLSCMEDSTMGGTVITAGDVDIDGSVLTADTIPVLAPANGTIDINTDGTFTYTPAPNYFGNDTAIISVCDAGVPAPGICVNDTLFITIYQTNDPPVIENDTNTTAEDNSVNGTIITAGDIDPDSLALIVDTVPVFGPSNGVVSVDTAGNYTYTPNPNFNGTEVIVFNVCDQGVPFPACTNDTLIIYVTAVNDTAIIVNDVASGSEDNSISSDILTVADYDIDTTALSVDIVPLSGPANGIILMNTDGTFTYWPNQDFNGTDVIIFNICDAGNPLPSICITDTLVITVNPVNDPPVTSGGTAGTNEDNPVSGNFLGGGDIDPDSTSLVVDTIPVSGPSNGTIDIDSTGSYTYTPDPDFNGTDTVIVSVCDNGTPLPPACTNDTIIVTVNPVNDNPTANSDNTLVCSGDTLVFDPLLNDSDVDGDSMSISSIVQPVNGTASTDGVTITYIPNAGYHGVDSLSYDVCDNGVPQLCSTATIYIDVNGPVSSGIQANEVLCFGDSTGSVTTSAFLVPTFTYLWNTGDTTASIFNVPAGFYSVTITDSLGCSIMDTATVLQPPQLLANGIITDVLCFGGNNGAIDLTVTGGSPNFSYLWNNGDTIQDINSLSAGSYDVEVTDNNGCTYTFSTTVSQPSAAISVTAVIDSSDCLNNIAGLIDITVSGGTAGYQFAWDNSATTEDINGVAGNYVLIVTDNNSCTDTSNHTITDNSNFTISTYDSLSFCQGDSIRLSADYNNGTFQWMFGGANIPGATDSILYASQTGTYSLNFVNACGAFVSNTISADVNQKPVLNASGGNEICEGAGTQFTVTGANTYTWSPSTGLNNASIGNPYATPVSTTDYTVTGFVGGCSEDTILNIVVHPLPVINISSTPFDCDLGAQLSATGGVSYLWSPAYGLDSVNIATPYATPVSSVTYSVLVTDSFNCSATATWMIFAQCDSLFIPNGITPDDDGSNDAWVINGINRFPANKLKIFNRWGNIVYKAEPYQNDWKGTCVENNVLIGEDLPDGTYFYILELGFGYPVKTGFIELRR